MYGSPSYSGVMARVLHLMAVASTVLLRSKHRVESSDQETQFTSAKNRFKVG